MAKISIVNITEHLSQYLEVLTPDLLYKTIYSNVVNSGSYSDALGVSRINISEEYKSKAINIIKNVIKKMRESNVPIKIDNMIFAIGYPKSYNLVKTYYDTLCETCLNNRKFINDDIRNNTKLLQSYEKKIRKKVCYLSECTYTLFVPLMRDKKNNDIIDETGLTNDSIKKISGKYKSLLIGNDAIVNEEKVARDMFELLKQDKKLEEIANKYTVTVDYCRSLLRSYLTLEEYDVVEKILKANSIKRYEYYNSIASLLIKYIVKGIDNNGEKESFCMLDYYTITRINPIEMQGFVFNLRCNSENRLLMQSFNKIINFFEANRWVGRVVTRESACYDDLKIIKDDEVYYLRDYVDQIFSTFEANGIVPYKKLVDLAFKRLVHGGAILPLLEEEKKEFKM